MFELRQVVFKELVDGISNNEILLPDFQRGFKWREWTKQRDLIASVLTKLPIGTLLLLGAKPDEYMCRKIGTRTKLSDEEKANLKESNRDVHVLIDGQQRVTTLMAFLSDLIPTSDCVSNTLKRKFYLKIPVFSLSGDSDIFGAHYLEPKEYMKPSGIPDFNTEQIRDYIDYFDGIKDEKSLRGITNDDDALTFAKEFFKIKNNALEGHYGKSVNQSTADGQECFYYIPLFLLFDAASRGSKGYEDKLKHIIEAISRDYSETIVIELVDTSNDSAVRKQYLKSVILDAEGAIISNSEIDEECKIILQHIEDNDDYSQIKKELKTVFDNRAGHWAKSFEEYLENCISDVNLIKIELQRTDKARAIDIYENLNMGGKSLDTFDLLLAKAATNSNGENLKDCILKNISSNHRDDYQLAFDNVFSNEKSFEEFKKYFDAEDPKGNTIQKDYSASMVMKSSDSEDELSPVFSKVLIDLIGIINYFNDSGVYDYSKADHFSCRYIKKEYLLNEVPSDKIAEYAVEASKGIDRALFFLQVMCGVRSYSDIAYDYSLVIIAFLLLNNEWTKNKVYMQYLASWYWSIIFSSEFSTEQNAAFEKAMKKTIYSFSNNDKDYFVSLAKRCFKNSAFVDEDILCLNSSDDILPPKSVSSAIYQYYLSKTYGDILKESCYKQGYERKTISAFSDEALEIHHINPVNELSTKSYKENAIEIKDMNKSYTGNQRNNPYNKYNSPLNYLLITKVANDIILNTSLDSYLGCCDDVTVSDVGIKGYIDYKSGQPTNNEAYIDVFLKKRFDDFKLSLKQSFRGWLSYANFEFDV